MSLNLDSNYLQFEIGMHNGKKHSIYEFDRFRLDVGKLMLYDGDGELQLPPKCVNTLAALVESAGEIISKDDLIDLVWQDTVVEESNLSQYLYLLRKTLGKTPDGRPYIETLRRRGYRFNGEAKRIEPAPKSGPQPYAQERATGRFQVERRGNIVALADWQQSAPAVIDQPVTATAAPPVELRQDTLVKFILAALGVAAIAALMFAFVWYRSAPVAQPPVERRGALTVERLTNGVNPQFVTISPDGRYLAYSDFDGQTWSLFVQQTGQPNQLEIIPPSKRAILEKTFSPDGSFIYFVAGDTGTAGIGLYRIPTLGGVQTKILDDTRSPVSFSPDGKEMVLERYDKQTGGSALVIAASDGSSERILRSHTREQERWVYPAWSPDGSMIAFVTIYPPEQGRSWSISGIDLLTGEISSLSPEEWDNCYRIAWMPNGEGLVFIGTKKGDGLSTRRDNVYYLDLKTGEARCLTVDGNRYQLSSLGVTADGGVLAVPDSRLSQIWQMSPDGDPRTAVQITHGLQDGRVGLAPLPDGRVGYVARTGEYLHLWLMNADGTEQKQLTNDPNYIQELRASPSGSFFVFSAHRSERTPLFRVDADGTNLRQLAFDVNGEGHSTISPDGDWIVYHKEVVEGPGRARHVLLKIPSAGGVEPVRVSDADCLMPHFSPDGEFLACVGEKGIVILRSQTGEVVKTFDVVQPALFNSGVSWTPDGQNLVYPVVRKKVSNLWVQPVNGGAARQLTGFATQGVWNFAFSRDGLRLYVVRVYQANDALLIRNF